ncbi:hypothetical protein RN01_28080 [Cupriavidus sp. SHE]|nr:hypothetical protein RN01_28080 [Cupriavidus sp. SHE]
MTRVTAKFAQFLQEQLALLSTKPFLVTRVTCVTSCVTCVTARVTQGGLVDALVMPASYVPELLAVDFVFDQQLLLYQLVDPLHHRGSGGIVVAGEDFSLEGLGAGGMVTAVVTEVPEANEQEACVSRQLHDLFGGPVLRFD